MSDDIKVEMPQLVIEFPFDEYRNAIKQALIAEMRRYRLADSSIWGEVQKAIPARVTELVNEALRDSDRIRQMVDDELNFRVNAEIKKQLKVHTEALARIATERLNAALGINEKSPPSEV